MRPAYRPALRHAFLLNGGQDGRHLAQAIVAERLPWKCHRFANAVDCKDSWAYIGKNRIGIQALRFKGGVWSTWRAVRWDELSPSFYQQAREACSWYDEMNVWNLHFAEMCIFDLLQFTPLFIWKSGFCFAITSPLPVYGCKRRSLPQSWQVRFFHFVVYK